MSVCRADDMRGILCAFIFFCMRLLFHVVWTWGEGDFLDLHGHILSGAGRERVNTKGWSACMWDNTRRASMVESFAFAVPSFLHSVKFKIFLAFLYVCFCFGYVSGGDFHCDKSRWIQNLSLRFHSVRASNFTAGINHTKGSRKVIVENVQSRAMFPNMVRQCFQTRSLGFLFHCCSILQTFYTDWWDI